MFVTDRAIHPRIRAKLLDLEAYNVKWVSGKNVWELQLGALGEIEDDAGTQEELSSPPFLTHADVTVAMPSKRSSKQTLDKNGWYYA